MHLRAIALYYSFSPDPLAESVEYWSRVWEIVGSNPSQVKPNDLSN